MYITESLQQTFKILNNNLDKRSNVIDSCTCDKNIPFTTNMTGLEHQYEYNRSHSERTKHYHFINDKTMISEQ